MHKDAKISQNDQITCDIDSKTQANVFMNTKPEINKYENDVYLETKNYIKNTSTGEENKDKIENNKYDKVLTEQFDLKEEITDNFYTKINNQNAINSFKSEHEKEDETLSMFSDYKNKEKEKISINNKIKNVFDETNKNTYNINCSKDITNLIEKAEDQEQCIKLHSINLDKSKTDSRKTSVDEIKVIPNKFIKIKEHINKGPQKIKKKKTSDKLTEDIPFKTHGFINDPCYQEILNKLDSFLESKNISIVKYALMLENDKSKTMNYIQHYNYQIREIAFKKLPASFSFLEYLNDINPRVRLLVLKKLTSKDFLAGINNYEYLKIYDKVCKLINDISVKIRIESARALKNFTRISNQDITRQFSKMNSGGGEAPGAFIHGFEDENAEVRVRCIESISILVKNLSMANKTFDFFVDLLNDEIEIVKEKSSFWMMQIARKYKIDVTEEMIDLIFCNFEEKNQAIKDNLYEVLYVLKPGVNLVFYVFDKLLVLLSKNIDKERIFKCIKLLVKKNCKYFKREIHSKTDRQKSISWLFDGPLFTWARNENNLVLDREPSLNDKRHFCAVIIIGVLMDAGYKFDVPKYFHKHIFYYKMKDKKFYQINNQNIYDGLKDANNQKLLSSTSSYESDKKEHNGLPYINNSFALTDKKVECLELNKTNLPSKYENGSYLITFLADLMKDLNHSKKNTIDFYKNIFSSKFANSEKDNFILAFFNSIRDKIRHNRDNKFKLFKINYGIDFSLDYESVLELLKSKNEFKLYKILINCPLKVKRRFNLPIKIDFSILWNPKMKNIFLRITGHNFRNLYSVRSNTSVYIYEPNGLEFKACLVYINGCEEIVISATSTIEVCI